MNLPLSLRGHLGIAAHRKSKGAASQFEVAGSPAMQLAAADTFSTTKIPQCPSLLKKREILV